MECVLADDSTDDRMVLAVTRLDPLLHLLTYLGSYTLGFYWEAYHPPFCVCSTEIDHLVTRLFFFFVSISRFKLNLEKIEFITIITKLSVVSISAITVENVVDRLPFTNLLYK